ncbi:polysaccharide deacetylase family protein [Bacillus sp. EB600]|uniref:polysaccharide deacetylase family protein n=1 Tax=Bacillus sp. EB600 TaxID=2806345 RepID=UPI00210C2459|nr:polysaccharide deacetylase family protein [Bacillus sp. EB600]MCQ6280751.1 polysaccharide deacetylase family protein [Bacillus sp. EB600]
MKKVQLVTCILVFSYLFGGQSAYSMASRKAEYKKNGLAIWEVKTKEKMVALTFDDGPNPIYTNQILDLLAKYHAKATFFVIGERAKQYPQVLKREVKERHEVANHTYSHIYDFDNSPAKLKKELDQSAKLIKQITGYKPILYRPVAGYYNNLILNTAIKNGYRVVLWSWTQDTRDWSCPGINKITNNVILDIKPGDITIFHDSGGDRTQTVCALENILKYLSKHDFQCVTVSEMIFRSEAIIPDPYPGKHER